MITPEEVSIMVEWSVLGRPYPPGIGRWEGFWSIVDPVCDRFLALRRETEPGDELGIKRLKEAGQEVVRAHNRAIREFRAQQAS